MNKINTIDVRGLKHEEKEKKIFPAVNGLKEGGALRLIFEFNPLPLVYMLKARNEFDISFEKEGPAEWIIQVKRTAPAVNQKAEFKQLLKELKDGQVSAETKEKAKKFLQGIDARTLGAVEQELIREGVSHDEIRSSLCDIHLEAMRDALVNKKIEVPAPHPVHTLMEEHKVILQNLKELGEFLKKLPQIKSFKELGEEQTEKLKDIAHHLVEAENHHQREEEALFPKLKAHDVVEPPQIMELDHVEFRKRKKELYQIAHNHQKYDFAEFKNKVTELGGFIAKELESHIFKEDNILYQIALQILTEEEWKEVKRQCDKIGYCCFTPADQPKGDKNMNGKIQTLDLRPMPPFERHEKIFEIWDTLKPGETLEIINDHDPRPLHYQFEAEQKGKYEWEYELKGPKDWSVKIKRI
ncbi:MAG: DUF438 domain-containing protein [Planctomycetota bacterium]